jgi:hypothetical protein
MRKICSLVFVVAALLAPDLGPANAAPANLNHVLKGAYAFSGAATCLVSLGGFNPDLTPVGPPAPFPFVTSFSIHGVRTFNGDGTGRVSARVTSIRLPSETFNRGSASASDIEAEFTYVVAPDLTATLSNVSLTGTVVAGTPPGPTFEITNFPLFSGRISQDHKTISLAHDDPTVETQTFFDAGGNPVQVQERVCQRSRTLLRQQ